MFADESAIVLTNGSRCEAFNEFSRAAGRTSCLERPFVEAIQMNLWRPIAVKPCRLCQNELGAPRVGGPRCSVELVVMGEATQVRRPTGNGRRSGYRERNPRLGFAGPGTGYCNKRR